MAKRDKPTVDKHPSSSDGYAQTAPLSDELAGVIADATPGLKAGELVAGRYRIVRFLARGGMGEVYEAEDGELRERIALKTIREERKGGAAEALFLREIQLSRRVTHPNVCRIFDVGRHDRGDGAHVVFLTMELLTGETLHDRIAREGRLPQALAASIARQMLAGLASAHEAGIVHRDLKTANVMLEPREDGKVRAVVTDFGLAHNALSERGGTYSGESGIIGTPAYMAPEQVEGGAVSASTDLYALGIVLYEMTTGTLPFGGSSALSIATKRLTEDAPSPRALRTDLPPHWERTIAACLERDPRRRPPSARAVTELLDADSNESIRHERLKARSRMARPLVALLVVVALGLVGMRIEKAHRESLAVALPERGVVLGAIRLDGPPSGFVVAARNAVHVALLGDVPLVSSPIEVGDGDDLVHLGAVGAARAGTPFVLDGRMSMARVDGLQRIELTLGLADPTTGHERWSAAESGPATELSMIVTRLVAKLRVAAHLPKQSAAPASSASTEALTRIRAEVLHHDYATALDDVEAAIVEAPHTVELRIEHARILDDFGMDVSAEVAEQRLVQLAPIVDERLRDDVTALTACSDVARVVPVLQRLHAGRPFDLEVSAALVAALGAAQRGAEALAASSDVLARARTIEERLAGQLVQLRRQAESDHSSLVVASYRKVYDDAVAARQPWLAASALEEGCVATYNCVGDDEARPVCLLAREQSAPLRRADVAVQVGTQLALVGTKEGSKARESALVKALRGAEGVGSFDVITETDAYLAAEVQSRADPVGADWRYEEAIAFAKAHHATTMMIELLGMRAAHSDRDGDLEGAERFRQRTYELATDSFDSDAISLMRWQEVRSAVLDGTIDVAARLASNLSVPAPGSDAGIIYTYRLSRIELAIEQARYDDVKAELRAFETDPPVTVYGFGRWVVNETRADVAYLRNDPVETERAASRALVEAKGLDPIGPRLLLAIGRAQQRKGTPGRSALSKMQTDVSAIAMAAERRWAQVQLFSLRRLSGEPPERLLAELDPFIEALSKPGTFRCQGLWARVERLRVYATTHDGRLSAERRALVADASALGYRAVADAAQAVVEEPTKGR